MIAFFEALFNPSMPFVRNALVAGLLSSVLFGILGTVVTVKRIAGLAGAISHAVLGGIGMALYLSATKVLPNLPPIAGAIVFAVLVVAPPTYYVNRFGLKKAREPYLVQEEQARLRGLLHVVGPRDPVLTELNRTWDLVQAGFVVVAPMTSNGVVQANAELFDAYVAQNEHTAKWLFLKRGDPRVAGKPVHATDGDHVLVARDGPP